MSTLRFRALTAIAAAAVIAAVFVVPGSPGASAAVVEQHPVFSCTADNTTTAAVKDNYNIFGGYINSTNYTTLGLIQFLNSILGSLGSTVPEHPALSVDFSTNLPATVPAGTAYNPSVDYSVSLPTELASAANTYLGIGSVKLKNASMTIAATSTSPSTFTGTLPTQTIALTPGAKASGTAVGALTAGSSGGINLTPSSAHVELDFENLFIGLVYVSGVPIYPYLHLGTFIFDCVPTSYPSLGSTGITPNSGTTSTSTSTSSTSTSTSTTSTSTTSTSTTSTSTTSTSTTSTSTTSTSTTTTEQPTSTTTSTTSTTTTEQPTSTTTSTTTTTEQPTTSIPGSHDAVSVSITGGYANGGPVTDGGFSIASDAFGVAGVSGSGSLPGTSGGTATVTVNISRFLFWSFGSVSVYDPGAGVNQTGYVLFGAIPGRSGNSTTVSGSWFTFDQRGFVPFTITATVTDNA